MAGSPNNLVCPSCGVPVHDPCLTTCKLAIRRGFFDYTCDHGYDLSAEVCPKCNFGITPRKCKHGERWDMCMFCSKRSKLSGLEKYKNQLREQRELNKEQGAEITAFNLCLILENILGELEKAYGHTRPSGESQDN